MEKEEQIIAELKAQLPKSDAQQRKTWAKRIVDNNLKIKRLSSLLLSDYKIATRFSWLLSDIGEYSNSFLEAGLPHLWAMRKEVKTFQFESCFVTYWSLCGIPEEQEGIALDLSLIHI